MFDMHPISLNKTRYKPHRQQRTVETAVNVLYR